MKETALKDLILFTDFSDNDTVKKAVSLFFDYNRDNYIDIQRTMACFSPDDFLPATYWQNYIVDILARSENAFSLTAEKQNGKEDSHIMKLASLELSVISKLYNLSFGDRGDGVQNLTDAYPGNSDKNHRRLEIVKALTCENPEESVNILYNYYKKYGAGILENYYVFEWKECLVGITNYDAVSFDDIIGYEIEKNALINNTKYFMAGRKAANALLYGDSGTGKSSSVKALISEFGHKGLKFINVDKEQINVLPQILDYISTRGSRFVIFMDDLSFEDNEVEYKQFKSVLEGNVKSNNLNSVLYVTSNRRNIIREVWSEREGSDDVHLRDTLQEKRSLSDRFGLLITYSAPTKEEYLHIVKELAAKEGLTVDDKLMSEALKWDVRRGSHSGRTAKYFIDYFISTNQ